MSNGKQSRRDPAITAAIIGAVTTVVVAVVSLLPTILDRLNSSNSNGTINQPTAVVQPTTAPAGESTSMPTPVPIVAPQLIYKETFDTDNPDWTEGKADHSDYFVERYIENGSYHRIMKTKKTDVAATVPLPILPMQDFCLRFDARISEVTENTAVVVNARANDVGTGSGSYYIIELLSNGTGKLWLDAPGEQGTYQIGVIEQSPPWSDGQMHTVQISFQGDTLEIYDQGTGQLISSMTFSGSNSLLTSGEIRIGLEILSSGQESTFELDNIYVYDRCP